MAEASIHSLVGTWTGGWRDCALRIEAGGQHSIRGVVRGEGDAGFTCHQRGGKIRGHWFDSLKSVYARDAAQCTLELTIDEGGAVLTGVAVDKAGAETTWTLRRLAVPRNEEGKLAAFAFKDASVFERLTRLPSVPAEALQAEALFASVRDVASATATGVKGAVPAPGNAQGDITYIPPVTLFTPYDGQAAVRAARSSRHAGKQLLTSTTKALVLVQASGGLWRVEPPPPAPHAPPPPLQRLGDAPEWVPPEDRPRSRSAAATSRGGGGGGNNSRASPPSDEAAADAEVAAATAGGGAAAGTARPGTAAAGGGAKEKEVRPPFRPVSGLFCTAAEDSRETVFLSTVGADTAPEDLAKTAKAAMAASMGAARALASPHLTRGAEGRLDVRLAPPNFLVSGTKPGPSSRAAGEFMPGDAYEVDERVRRSVGVRGPLDLRPVTRARPASSAGGEGEASPAPAAAAEPAKPFRTCGPPPPVPAGPFLTAAATDFDETLAGRISRAKSAAPGPRGRRPGTAASAASGGGAEGAAAAAGGAKPDPLADRPVYNQYSKDISRYSMRDPSLVPEYICKPPADPRIARPDSPERKRHLETLKVARATGDGAGARWREVISPGVRPTATPGVMTMPANLYKLRPQTAAAGTRGGGSSAFAYSATSPRKMSMALAVIQGRAQKSSAVERPGVAGGPLASPRPQNY